MEKSNLIREICPTSAQEWIKNGALLIDVREEDEVSKWAFDVPNLINIPLSELEDRFDEIPRHGEVIMVCASGIRSLRATGFLINHDFTNVVNMQHGLERWIQKGFPTKGDRTPEIVSDSCCSLKKYC